MRNLTLAILAGVMALGGAAAPALAGPVEVTRFHLGDAVERGTMLVEPSGTGSSSTELLAYAQAVRSELAGLGYHDARDPAPSDYVATVDVLRGPRAIFDQRPPMAGARPAPVRRGRRDAILSELSVQIKRRDDATVVWEGRAQTPGAVAPGQGARQAPRLARALFRGFPGRSGVTISVP